MNWPFSHSNFCWCYLSSNQSRRRLNIHQYACRVSCKACLGIWIGCQGWRKQKKGVCSRVSVVNDTVPANTIAELYDLLTKIRRTRWPQRSRNRLMLPPRALLRWWRSVWSFCGNICSNRQTVKIRAKKLLTLQKSQVKRSPRRTVGNQSRHTSSKSCTCLGEGRGSGWKACSATSSSCSSER